MGASEGSCEHVAWVSVERGERDAQRFWLTVIDALAGADGAVERLAATPAFDGQAIAGRLRAHLRSLAQPVVLIVNDLHDLRSSDVLRLLEGLLSQLPPGLRVVPATRKEPDLDLTG